MTEDLKELAELQPKSRFVIIKGESYEIKPFKFKHAFQVLSRISNMVEDIDLTPNPYEDPNVTYTKLVIKLLGKHGEDVIGIMAIALGKPESFFDDLETEEGIELASVIWEINKDFFVRKLQPKLKAMGLTNQDQSDSQSEKEKNTLPTDITEISEIESQSENSNQENPQ